MRSKTEWRRYRNYLQSLAYRLDVFTMEYKNVMKRIQWINNNRI